MESYIRISNINDFLYCPMSIYLHGLYEAFDRSAYLQTPQIVGTANHKSLDEGTYSTANRYVTGLDVYSTEYGLCGKIDFYDAKEKLLVERKTRIKTVQRGYVYQLYAQYFCLREMGYGIERLALHSLEDNRRYPIGLPSAEEIAEFRQLLEEMRSFDPTKIRHHVCDRCSESIYGALNW